MRRSVFALVALSLSAWLAPPATVGSQADDGMVVEGLRGQLPRAAVADAVGRKMNEFVACVGRRKSANDLLAGRVVVEFVVAVDGRPRIARIASSDLGDRASETCIADLAATLRFPAPSGGEASATQTFTFPLDPEVRPPIEWSAARAEAARAVAVRAASRCRLADGRVRVTAYVATGGRVVTAGGSARDLVTDTKVGCVVDSLARATFAEPGSYPAKVSFDVGVR